MPRCFGLPGSPVAPHDAISYLAALAHTRTPTQSRPVLGAPGAPSQAPLRSLAVDSVAPEGTRSKTNGLMYANMGCDLPRRHGIAGTQKGRGEGRIILRNCIAIRQSLEARPPIQSAIASEPEKVHSP